MTSRPDRCNCRAGHPQRQCRSKYALPPALNRHQVSQAQYYQWRDRLLKDGQKLFAHGGIDKHQQRLENENRNLKTIIGALTVELKKSEFFDEPLP